MCCFFSWAASSSSSKAPSVPLLAEMFPSEDHSAICSMSGRWRCKAPSERRAVCQGPPTSSTHTQVPEGLSSCLSSFSFCHFCLLPEHLVVSSSEMTVCQCSVSARYSAGRGIAGPKERFQSGWWFHRVLIGSVWSHQWKVSGVGRLF